MAHFRFVLIAVSAVSLARIACGTDEPTWGGRPIQYGAARQLGVVAERAINESSGLACSRCNREAFWTHNDSGDAPRLFLIDREGKTLATLLIEGARALDWEDLASYESEGQGYLLIGDVGDNSINRGIERPGYSLYLVQEPEVSRDGAPHSLSVRFQREITFSYEDGPHNCESMAVDPIAGKIYLVAKERKRAECDIYELPLTPKQTEEQLTARRIGTLGVPTATGMDLSCDGCHMVIVTRRDAYEYTRGAGDTWPQALTKEPRILPMPDRRNGESVCYGIDGESLYLTSEHACQPLWEIPAVTSRR